MIAGGVAVEGVSLALGSFALRDVSLAIGRGEILVLLGPNGAGKSVTIETIAGFHRPRAGRIAIAGHDVTRLPPERRHIGLVFQDFSLFPHLSVAQNIAIGMRRATAPVPADSPVPLGDGPALLDYFGLAPLADRRPRDLSIGERQRTSLARAFATRPDLLLFDEPFSALDAVTRDRLRGDLGRFMRDAGIPAIVVTHDPIDARVLADRLAVIDAGRIVQQGAAADVFNRPCNAFIAAFLGIENVLPGRIDGGAGGPARVSVAERLLYCRIPGDAQVGDRVVVCFRAEEVRLYPGGLSPDGGGEGVNRLPGRIVAVTDLGPLTRISLDCGFVVQAYAVSGEARHRGFAPDDPAYVEIDAASVHVAPAG